LITGYAGEHDCMITATGNGNAGEHDCMITATGSRASTIA
jgi:hypothetical protein